MQVGGRHPNQVMQIASAGNGDVQIQPLPAQITLSDRLKAIALVALTGALGVGAVLLGRALWYANTDEALSPLPEDTESTPAQPSLRDRVAVITPGASPTTSPESLPPAAPPSMSQTRLRQFSPPSAHNSYGFGNQGGTAVAPNRLPGSAPIQAQAQPTTQATQAASQPGKPTARQPSSPVALIAALLKAPRSTAIGSAGTVAIAPHPSATLPDLSRPPGRLAPGQVAPAAPPPASPGSQSPDTQTGRTQTPGIQPQTPNVQPGAAQPPVAVKPPPLQDSIYVDRLTITGNTRFSQRELAAVVQTALNPGTAPSGDPAVINRTLTPAELVQASEAITKLYTDRGYINSGAYVPAEVLNGARPEIRVVEGKLESINVKIEPPKFLWLAQRLSQNYVRRRLARSIQAPLQIDQLVDAVKFLEQDPLIDSISTELAPGTTTGKSVLNVRVKQAPPLHLTVSIDNGRAPSVGKFRQQVILNHANLLGLGDRFQIGYNHSEGSHGLDLSFAVPINPSNGTLSFLYSSNRGRVIEQPFQDLDIKSRSQNYEISFRQPIIQTSNELFALSLRGTYYRNEGVFLETFNDGIPIPFPARGSDLNGITKITTLRFGQEWVKRSERDVISLQSEFNFGVNALGSTQLEQPPDGNFFSWQGRGFWVHSFAPDMLFALKGQIQFADRPLVPVEQISFGGIDTVRGYRTSVLLADNGWFTSAELYLPILRIPKWRSVVQLVPFFDFARGWNRGDEQPDPSHLVSTGLGLQWKIGDNFRARLDWGIPLINTTALNGQSLRESFFFSVLFSP